MILVMDCETTGLFDYSKRADEDGQPRMASLACVIVSDDWVPLEGLEFYHLVKPDGWTMSAEATAINGLTNEQLMAEGLPISEVLDKYLGHHEMAQQVAGYGVDFDLKMLRGELRRSGRPDLFGEKPQQNVIRIAAAACHAKGAPGGQKLKKLKLAYEILIGEPMEDAHNALADVKATIRIMQKIRETTHG